MVKCSFCARQIEKGTGKIFVTKAGKILNFCANKCEKNMFKLKRKPSNLKWVTSKKKTKSKIGTETSEISGTQKKGTEIKGIKKISSTQ